MSSYDKRSKTTRPARDEAMRQRMQPAPMADCPTAPNAASEWYASEVLRLDTANQELFKLYELRGGALVRVDHIINTFQSDELAVKAIRELFRQLKKDEAAVQHGGGR